MKRLTLFDDKPARARSCHSAPAPTLCGGNARRPRLPGGLLPKKTLSAAATALLLFCALMLFCQSAQAEFVYFRGFSVDVPPGWNVEREGNTVAFIASDNSAAMQVTVESISKIFKEGMSAKELAEAYAEELKGSTPEMEDNDPNYYSFDFSSPEGQEAEASIVVSGARFYLITIRGKHTDLANMVESVLLSIQ